MSDSEPMNRRYFLETLTLDWTPDSNHGGTWTVLFQLTAKTLVNEHTNRTNKAFMYVYFAIIKALGARERSGQNLLVPCSLLSSRLRW